MFERRVDVGDEVGCGFKTARKPDEIARNAGGHLRGCNGLAGRAAWDETAVLIAVRGTEPLFNVHRGTYRMVGEGGDDEWVPDEANGPHARVTEKANKLEVGRIIDELMCRPPKRGN